MRSIIPSRHVNRSSIPNDEKAAGFSRAWDDLSIYMGMVLLGQICKSWTEQQPRSTYSWHSNFGCSFLLVFVEQENEQGWKAPSNLTGWKESPSVVAVDWKLMLVSSARLSLFRWRTIDSPVMFAWLQGKCTRSVQFWSHLASVACRSYEKNKSRLGHVHWSTKDWSKFTDTAGQKKMQQSNRSDTDTWIHGNTECFITTFEAVQLLKSSSWSLFMMVKQAKDLTQCCLDSPFPRLVLGQGQEIHKPYPSWQRQICRPKKV